MANFTERNQNSVPSILAKSNAGDNADVILWADPTTHRLLVNNSISGGSLSNNTAAPSNTNIGVLPAVANAAAPSYTEGNQVLLSTDLAGALRITGSVTTTNLSVGATGSAVPASANYAGYTDGTNLRGARVFDADSGVGTEYVVGVNLRASASGGSVELLGQKAMAGSIPVVLASDQGSIPVAATLSAETTKVIGTVNIAAAQTLATVTTVSTVTAVSDAQVQGKAASGAPKSGNPVQVGAVFNTTQPTVTTGQTVELQATARGALMVATGVDALTVSATNLSTNIAQINGVAPLMGAGVTGTGSPRVTLATDQAAIATWGMGATGSAVPSGANYKGLIATTSNPTAATAGNLVGAMADKLGRQVVVVGHVRDLKGNQITTITSSVAETTVVTAVASTFLDVYGCIVVNSSATAANVSFKDSTAGTTQFNIYVPAGETRGFMLPSSDAFKQTTVNTNWTATSSASVASLVISMLYVKNI